MSKLKKIFYSFEIGLADEKRQILFIVSISLILRLAYVLTLNYLPYSDMVGYEQNAHSIIIGQGIPANGFVDQYPLYPFMLAAIYSLLGHNYLMVRIVQTILSSLVCILTYLTAKRIFNNPKIALIAGLITAIFPDLILYCGTILTETLYTLLIILALWSWQTALDRHSWKWRIVVGVVLGLGLLTRSVILVFIPLALAWEFIHSWPDRRAGLTAIAVIGLTMTVVYFPWAMRNYKAYQTITPVSTSVGYGLWGGNNPQASGYWVPDPWTPAQRKYLATLSSAEANSYAIAQGWNWIKGQPGNFLQLVGLKISRLFSLKPDGIYKGNFFGKYVEAALPMTARATLWSLSLIGLAFSLNLWRRLGLIYALLLSHLMITIIFFAYARYLVPLIPALAILSAYGLAVCQQKWVAWKDHSWDWDGRYRLAVAFWVILALNWGWDVYRNLNVFRAWKSLPSLTEFDRTKSLEKFFESK